MAGKNNTFRKRLLKVLLMVILVPALIVGGIHIWFVQNARSVLKQYITDESGGKLKLELSQLDLNLLSKRLQIHEADLISIDSANEAITYHVAFRTLSLRVASVWALLVNKKLLLDSIKLQDPVIEVMQWRKDTTQALIKDELSIPQEMGKVYRSMIDALNEFGIRRIVINNAKIGLINKMKPGSEPVTVSNIYFDLARSNPNTTNSKDVANKETIELKTTHQNIAMPGGRHRLSFKSFKLQLFRQRIEMDSCTVTAIATDSSKSNYRIFFKKLSLTGVDFNAMSAQNVIKAGSVYCENPFFYFDLYRSDAVKKKTEIPDPEKILRELSGNLDLAFVGVRDAGIHININGKTKRSFFNSNKDNFEMRGFRINPQAEEPVAIKQFDMMLRDYHLYNEDSSSVYSFDSLHFLNSKIVLNNFSIASTSGIRKIRNDLNIEVPYFELTQMDWYQLIFNQNLVAKEAVLQNPVINFVKKTAARAGKKLNLFQTLQNLDSLVALNKVSVTNGQVNLQLAAATSVNIQKINFSIHSNKLLGSTNREGLRSAVDYLSFSKGILRFKDITAQLQNARYTGNNLVHADKVSITGPGNKIIGDVNNVYIDNLQMDDKAEIIEVDGMGWQSASVGLKALPIVKGNGNSSIIHLNNVEGNNTQLNFSGGSTSISTFVNTLTASSLYKKGNAPLQLEGFKMAGNNFLLQSAGTKIVAGSYKIVSNEPSYLNEVQLQQINGRDSLNIQSSNVGFSANLNGLLANDIHFTSVNATAPVIKISKRNTGITDTAIIRDTSAQPVSFLIDEFYASQPDIHISTYRNDSVTVINIPASEKSFVVASDIVSSAKGMQLRSLKVNTTTATYVKATGEKLGVEKGKIDLDLSNIRFGKKDDKFNWSGLVNHLILQNANGLQMGRTKDKLLFNQASLGNLSLSSDYFPGFGELMKANVSAWLSIPEGQYVDSNTTMQWYNAKYNNSNRTLSLDSFVYHPTKPLDSALAHADHRFDYITVKTGAVAISGLDVEQYKKDSSFIANAVHVANPVMIIYRDQQPPSSPNKKYKPLPVEMIKRILQPVALQSAQITDGTITYTEKNGKSRKEGTVVLSQLNGQLKNIKNYALSNVDSLSLSLNGYLMDSAFIHVNFNESYSDSLSKFLITAQIDPTPFSVLNPVLVPLSNIKLSSGRLDSLSFHAIGGQDLALGEMNMHYHNLRIQLVKDGDAAQSTLLQKVISFIANTFLIKNNNTQRKAVMYYKREEGQSFTNYIVKITLSGILSSVGVKSNRRYMKQYYKEMKGSSGK